MTTQRQTFHKHGGRHAIYSMSFGVKSDVYNLKAEDK